MTSEQVATVDSRAPAQADLEAILAPVLTIGPAFKRWALALGAVVAWAIFAWMWQLSHGLGVTGLSLLYCFALWATWFIGPKEKTD